MSRSLPELPPQLREVHWCSAQALNRRENRKGKDTHFNHMSNRGTIIVDTQGKLIFRNDFMQK